MSVVKAALIPKFEIYLFWECEVKSVLLVLWLRLHLWGMWLKGRSEATGKGFLPGVVLYSSGGLSVLMRVQI